MTRQCLIVLAALGLCACNTEKIAQLEKENADLRKQVADSKHVDLATQEKCSNAAQRYFEREYVPDKNTILLTQQNHYNQARGKCYIFIELHTRLEGSTAGGWDNLISLTDVYENDEVAKFFQYTAGGPVIAGVGTTPSCEIEGKKCGSIDEFNQGIHSFMSD
jgi:hypothetical protein